MLVNCDFEPYHSESSEWNLGWLAPPLPLQLLEHVLNEYGTKADDFTKDAEASMTHDISRELSASCKKNKEAVALFKPCC